MDAKTMRIAVVLLCTLTGACSTTYRLSSATPDQSDSWAKLDSDGRTRDSYILADNQWTRAKSFSVGDSTLVLQLSGQRTADIPLASVEQVVFRNPGEGAATGALLGLGFSLLVGIRTASSFQGPGDGGSATSWGVVAGGLVAAVTVPVGALIGAIMGSPDRFRFEPPSLGSPHSP